MSSAWQGKAVPIEQEDKRLTFDKVPETYERARPGYPSGAFDQLFSYIKESLPDGPRNILEIGPGTGQATRVLLDYGAAVTAVEIGPHLAEFMRHKFAGRSGLKVVTGAFEDVELPACNFDLVFAATAYHWLDPAIRLHKTCRLLAPGGVLGTLSTIQIRSDLDRGYFDRTSPIYKRYFPAEKPLIMPEEEAATPADYAEFRASGLLTDVRLKRYRWDQVYNTASYEALLRSYSDMQTMKPDAREALITDLKIVIDNEYGGKVVRPLVIALTLGRVSYFA